MARLGGVVEGSDKHEGMRTVSFDSHRHRDGFTALKRRTMSAKGPTCPVCNGRLSDVIDTRPVSDGMVRRRRACACGHRFTTYEIVHVDAALDWQI